MTNNDDRLERMERKLDENSEILSQIRERTAALEVKAGVWGMIGGMISGIALYLGLKH